MSSSAITMPISAWRFLKVIVNSSSSLLMKPTPTRAAIIMHGLYQIAWATAASLVAIMLLIIMAGCEHPADRRPRHYSADSGSGFSRESSSFSIPALPWTERADAP